MVSGRPETASNRVGNGIWSTKWASNHVGNGICSTKWPSNHIGNGIVSAQWASNHVGNGISVGNGLPITLEMEFGRPATISNVFQTSFCLPARTLQHMKSPRFEESRATFTNKTYFGRFASAFISLFCDGLYFATIVTPCGFISLYCITWNIYLIIIGIPTSTYRERSCS